MKVVNKILDFFTEEVEEETVEEFDTEIILSPEKKLKPISIDDEVNKPLPTHTPTPINKPLEQPQTKSIFIDESPPKTTKPVVNKNVYESATVDYEFTQVISPMFGRSEADLQRKPLPKAPKTNVTITPGSRLGTIISPIYGVEANITEITPTTYQEDYVSEESLETYDVEDLIDFPSHEFLDNQIYSEEELAPQFVDLELERQNEADAYAQTKLYHFSSEANEEDEPNLFNQDF